MRRPTLLALLFILSGFTAEAGEIRLRERANCSGSVVRLGDVAEVHATDIVTQHRLAETALFPLPAVGRMRVVKRQEVQQLLALSAVSLKEYRFSGAMAVAVRAKPAETPEPIAAATATGQTQSEAAAADVQMAVFTTRPLRQGAVVEAADVELLPAIVPGGPAAVAKLEDIVGQELKRSLPAGKPVQAENVQTPRLVQRGDEVTVRCLAAGVTITTSGKALDAGGQGDVVEVEMSDSRERLFARIVNFRTVAVYAGTPTFPGARTVSSN